MIKPHLLSLFHFDLWANARVLDCLIAHQIEDQQCQFWMSHLLNAEQIWLDRVRAMIPTVTVQALHDWGECKAMLERLNQEWIHFIEHQSEENLLQEIAYQNSRGHSFSNALKDIATHVVNHSTHHRSQIVARLREKEVPPPPTDYIFFLRE